MRGIRAVSVAIRGAPTTTPSAVYLQAVEHAVRTQVPRADWLTVEIALTSLGTDVIAAGAAMQVLNARYGLPDPAAPPVTPLLTSSR